MPEQSELLAIAATWPAQRVPCLFVSKMSYLHNKRGQLRHFTRAGHATPCCDNVTMFSCPPMVDYYLLHIFGVVTPFGHRGLKMFRIFSCHRSFIKFLRCCVIAVAKLKKCCVPSYAPNVSRGWRYADKNKFKDHRSQKKQCKKKGYLIK